MKKFSPHWPYLDSDWTFLLKKSIYFERLEEARVISAGLKETLKKMRGFRNRLVPQYGRVEDEIV